MAAAVEESSPRSDASTRGTRCLARAPAPPASASSAWRASVGSRPFGWNAAAAVASGAPKIEFQSSESRISDFSPSADASRAHRVASQCDANRSDAFAAARAAFVRSFPGPTHASSPFAPSPDRFCVFSFSARRVASVAARAYSTRASVASSLARRNPVSPSSAVRRHPEASDVFAPASNRASLEASAPTHAAASASASGYALRLPSSRTRRRLRSTPRSRLARLWSSSRRAARAPSTPNARGASACARRSLTTAFCTSQESSAGARRPPSVSKDLARASRSYAECISPARRMPLAARTSDATSRRSARGDARDADHASAAGRGTASGNARAAARRTHSTRSHASGGSRASEGQRRDQRLVTFSMTLVSLSAFWFFSTTCRCASALHARAAPTTSSSSVAACSGCSSARRANVAAAGVAAHRSRNRARTAATRATTASSSPRAMRTTASSTPSSAATGSPPPADDAFATCARIASRLPSRDSRRCFSGNASSSESFVSNRLSTSRRASARVAKHSASPPAAAPGMARSPSPASDSARRRSTDHGGGTASAMSSASSSQSPSRCEHRARSRNHSRRDRRDRAAASNAGVSEVSEISSASSRRSASYMSRALDASPSICAVSAARVRAARVSDASSPSNARVKQSRAATSSPDARCSAASASHTAPLEPFIFFSAELSFSFFFSLRDTSASRPRCSALGTRECEISWSFVSSRASWSARASSASTPEPRHPPSNAAARTASASKRASGSAAAARSAHAASVSSADAAGSNAAIASRTPSRRELWELVFTKGPAFVSASYVSASYVSVALLFSPTERPPARSAASALSSAASRSAVRSADAVSASRRAKAASGSRSAAGVAARTSGSSPARYCRTSFTARRRPNARSRSKRRRRSAAEALEKAAASASAAGPPPPPTTRRRVFVPTYA